MGHYCKMYLFDLFIFPGCYTPGSSSSECVCVLLLTRSKNSTEPVTTQPSPVASATSRVTTILCTGGSWSTGLLDIFQDKGVCVWGLLCSPCLECSLASHYGECFCFPLLLGSTVALRTSTRERFKIRGTLFGDWMVVHCCWPFAVCQMAREMKRRPVFQVYETSQLQPTPPAKGAFV
uniref:PLAC8 like 1 n=1 Tax=Varanus komodoensis TaxID=61221 RepID=A0A8D2L623_VARKO